MQLFIRLLIRRPRTVKTTIEPITEAIAKIAVASITLTLNSEIIGVKYINAVNL